MTFKEILLWIFLGAFTVWLTIVAWTSYDAYREIRTENAVLTTRFEEALRTSDYYKSQMEIVAKTVVGCAQGGTSYQITALLSGQLTHLDWVVQLDKSLHEYLKEKKP